jgi:hypothetical protein
VERPRESDWAAPTSHRKRRRAVENDASDSPSPPEHSAAKRSRVFQNSSSRAASGAGQGQDNDDDVVNVDDFIPPEPSASRNFSSSRARSSAYEHGDNDPAVVFSSSSSAAVPPRSRASALSLTADFMSARDRTMSFLRSLYAPMDNLDAGVEGGGGDDLVFGGGGRGARRGGRGGPRGRFMASRTYMPQEPFSYMPSTLYPSTHGHGRGGRGMHALSFMNRDFGPEDYEMLLQLDEAAKAQEASKHAAVRELKLSSLPIVPMPSVGDTTARVVKPIPSTSSASSAVILDDDDVIDLDNDSAVHVTKVPTVANEDCAICREDMPVGLPVKMIPACLHRFHGDCIDTWIRINPVCPICKADV